jgi:hypothetical protein
MKRCILILKKVQTIAEESTSFLWFQDQRPWRIRIWNEMDDGLDA